MGFVSETFGSEKSVSVLFESLTSTFTDGVFQPEAWTTVGTYTALKWTSGSSVTSVSDRLKTQVDGIIALDYDSTVAAVTDEDRFTIGSDIFKIVHVENVGEQNEVLQIAYRRDKGDA